MARNDKLLKLEASVGKELSALSDYEGSIQDLIDLLYELGDKLGKGTIIHTDAGYNNVMFRLGGRNAHN